jgi:hypothetical protein
MGTPESYAVQSVITKKHPQQSGTAVRDYAVLGSRRIKTLGKGFVVTLDQPFCTVVSVYRAMIFAQIQG